MNGQNKESKIQIHIKKKTLTSNKKKLKNLIEKFKIHIYTLYFIKYKIFRKINITK